MSNDSGTCFHDCAMWMLDHADDYPDALLVHGLPTQPVPPYQQFGHAWIRRDDDTVLTPHPTRGLIPIAAVVFYIIGNVWPDDCTAYTHAEAADLMLKTEHSGPWDKRYTLNTIEPA